MSDLTVQALQYAIDGLSLRQQATASNIANAGTPGYSAEEVDFESGLQQALDSGTVPSGSPAVTTSTAPAGIDGNNVNLSDELVTANATTLRYQTMVDALNTQFRITAAAIDNGGQ